MLRTADGAPVHGLDVDESGLAQPFEVQAHRVGVQAQPLGQFGRRQRPGRARELLIHREAGLVAECFQDRQQVHSLDGTGNSGIFSRAHWFYSVDDHRASDLHTPSRPPTRRSSDDVRRVLAGVLDPELHASIVELGMVHDVAGRAPTATCW